MTLAQFYFVLIMVTEECVASVPHLPLHVSQP